MRRYFVATLATIMVIAQVWLADVSSYREAWIASLLAGILVLVSLLLRFQRNLYNWFAFPLKISALFTAIFIIGQMILIDAPMRTVDQIFSMQVYFSSMIFISMIIFIFAEMMILLLPEKSPEEKGPE